MDGYRGAALFYPCAALVARGALLTLHTLVVGVASSGAEWPLLLEDPDTKALKGISMYDNDGVLYRGTEVVHWRDKMPDEYQVCSAQAFKRTRQWDGSKQQRVRSAALERRPE